MEADDYLPPPRRSAPFRRAHQPDSTVAKDPAAFVGETQEVVAALKHRIGREDRALYDLSDRAGLASAA